MSRTKDPLTCSCSCGGIDTEWHRYWECTKHVISRNGVRTLFPTLLATAQLTGIVPIGTALSLSDVAKVQKHVLDVVIATSEARLVLDQEDPINHGSGPDNDGCSHDHTDSTDDAHAAAAAAAQDVMRSHQSGSAVNRDKSSLAGLGTIQPLPPMSQEALDSLQEDPPLPSYCSGCAETAWR